MQSAMKPEVPNHTKVYYMVILQNFSIGSDQPNKMTTRVKIRTPLNTTSDSQLFFKIQNNYIIPVSRISMNFFLSNYMYNMLFKVMSIFTKIPRPAKMMLDKAS